MTSTRFFLKMFGHLENMKLGNRRQFTGLQIKYLFLLHDCQSIKGGHPAILILHFCVQSRSASISNIIIFTVDVFFSSVPRQLECICRCFASCKATETAKLTH
jgi:hypothetical protein